MVSVLALIASVSTRLTHKMMSCERRRYQPETRSMPLLNQVSILACACCRFPLARSTADSTARCTEGFWMKEAACRKPSSVIGGGGVSATPLGFVAGRGRIRNRASCHQIQQGLRKIGGRDVRGQCSAIRHAAAFRVDQRGVVVALIEAVDQRVMEQILGKAGAVAVVQQLADAALQVHRAGLEPGFDMFADHAGRPRPAVDYTRLSPSATSMISSPGMIPFPSIPARKYVSGASLDIYVKSARNPPATGGFLFPSIHPGILAAG